MDEQRPTYQESLRAIGHFLDGQVYRHVLLYEMPEGFVVRALQGASGDLAPDAIEVPLDDVAALIDRYREHRSTEQKEPPRPPLCPTGYEDFFRALGYELDMAGAILVRIVELSAGILVSYSAYNDDNVVRRFEAFYTPDAIEVALARAYGRRVGPKSLQDLPLAMRRIAARDVADSAGGPILDRKGR